MNKKNLIPIIVLVVLVIIYALTKTRNYTEKRIEFFGIDSVKIGAIELITVDDTLKLAKVNGEWMIDFPIQYPPVPRKMEDIFGKVLKIETSKIPVSESESSFEKYNLTDSLGTIVRLYDVSNKLLSESIVGKSDNYNFSHARKKGENKVYQLVSNISYMIKPDIKSWRNKTILELEELEISQINFASEEFNYTLTATDSLWQYNDFISNFSIKAPNASMKSIASGLKRVNVSDFIDHDYESYADKFAKPLAELTITDFTGKLTDLKFVEGEEKKLVVMKDDETEHLFIMHESWLNKFKKSKEDFEK